MVYMACAVMAYIAMDYKVIVYIVTAYDRYLAPRSDTKCKRRFEAVAHTLPLTVPYSSCGVRACVRACVHAFVCACAQSLHHDIGGSHEATTT